MNTDKTRNTLIELLHGLTSPKLQEREQATDAVTDVGNAFSKRQARMLAAALVEARLAEDSPSCQEAQLNALADLHGWHCFDADLLSPLQALGEGDLQGSQKEHFDELMEEP